MRDLSRRTLLKGLGAIPLLHATRTLHALAAISAQPQTVPDTAMTLNVVLHGLFVMNFTTDNIQLFTPFIAEHKYFAGGWDYRKMSTLAQGSYSLKGTDPVAIADRQDPNTLGDCALVLSQKKYGFKVNPAASYVTVTLPRPKHIYMLRCLTSPPAPKLFRGAPVDNVSKFSLCQVLTYPVQHPGALKLEGTGWQPDTPQIDPATNVRTSNLHLWAEPDTELPPSHALAAYKEVLKLIPPLEFTLATDATAARDKVTNVPGVSTTDEMGLSEWRLGEGSHTSNCGLLVVTP